VIITGRVNGLKMWRQVFLPGEQQEDCWKGSAMNSAIFATKEIEDCKDY